MYELHSENKHLIVFIISGMFFTVSLLFHICYITIVVYFIICLGKTVITAPVLLHKKV